MGLVELQVVQQVEKLPRQRRLQRYVAGLTASKGLGFRV